MNNEMSNEERNDIVWKKIIIINENNNIENEYNDKK